MVSLWFKNVRTWCPRWFRDEWEGEAGIALLEAIRTYDPTKGAKFGTWLFRMCWVRVQKLKVYFKFKARARWRCEKQVKEPVEVPAPEAGMGPWERRAFRQAIRKLLKRPTDEALIWKRYDAGEVLTGDEPNRFKVVIRYLRGKLNADEE